MARKSRSKQRSKGAGTRSGSAGGKSQGGGRSSAGKGKSQGGSGKSGGGKSGGGKSGGSKGKGTSSRSSTKSKSPSNRSPSTAPAPKKKPTLTGKGMGPQGKLGTAQSQAVRARFKAREAAGLSGLTGGPKGTGPAGSKGSTISIYRASQKKQVQDAARQKNAIFKAERDVKSGQVPGQGGAMSPAAREAAAKQLEAKRAEIAAAEKKEATRQSTFDSNRLFGNYNAQIGGKFATTLADTFAKPKYMYQGNMAGRLPGLSNYYTPDVGTGMPYMKGGKLRGVPFTGGDKTGSLTKFKVPKDAKLSRSVLGVRQYKLNPSQMKNLGMGVTDDAAKFAAKGLGKYGVRAIPFVGAVPSLIDAGMRFKDKDYTGAALSVGSAIPGKVGWASLAGLAAHDISKSMNVGTETQTASTATGGLNIGGGVDSGEAASNTGRTVVTTNKDKNISYDIGGIAKDVGLGLADAATFNKFDFDNLGRPGDDKTFTQKFETFKKSPLQQAIISKQTGIDAKRIINEGGPAAESLFKNYIGDIDASSKKGVRNPIARFLKDVGSDDATAMAGRAIDAFGYDDENFSNDPNKLTKFLSSISPIPNLSEENVQDIRHTFNKDVTKETGIQGKSILKNVPYTQALGFANRIVSGKLSDSTGEAMNQLGMQNVGGIDDAINLGMQINTNKQTEGTTANKRFGELDNLIQKYGPGKGQIPTIPSIIKGIGGAVGRSGGSGSPMQIQGGSGMTATLPVNQQVAQEALPLPTTATQTGTESGNLASIMQNAYTNQMSLYGMNPNYFANIMQQRFNTRPRRFRQVFNRGYF